MTARAVVRSSFADGSYELDLDSRAGCAGCQGVCMWRLLPTVERTRFASGAALPVGLAVVVSLPQRYVLLTSMLLYGLPLVSLLGGGLLGTILVGGDLATLVGALSALVLGLSATPRLRQSLERTTARHLIVRPLR